MDRTCFLVLSINDHEQWRTFDGVAQNCYWTIFSQSGVPSYGSLGCPLIHPNSGEFNYLLDILHIPTLHAKIGIVNKIDKILLNEFPTQI